MIESSRAQAERLADVVLEQLERLGASEHEEAYVLTLIAQRLLMRTLELGEVIEFEAREVRDQGAIQMATALQARCASLSPVLDQIASDPRFGLLPTDGRGVAARSRRSALNGHAAGES